MREAPNQWAGVLLYSGLLALVSPKQLTLETVTCSATVLDRNRIKFFHHVVYMSVGWFVYVCIIHCRCLLRPLQQWSHMTHLPSFCPYIPHSYSNGFSPRSSRSYSKISGTCYGWCLVVLMMYRSVCVVISVYTNNRIIPSHHVVMVWISG